MNGKRFMSALIFAGGVLPGLMMISRFFYPSNDITRNWQSFYRQERVSIDCLFIGNSHAFASFDTALFDEELGKRSYVLASNSQTAVQAYYNVEEVLNYQSPRIIVLEASCLDGNSNWQNGKETDETYDRDWKKESNIDGMRFGTVKLKAIIHQYTKRNWLYALDKIGRSHQNWKNPEIIRDNWDFYRYEAKGFTGFRPAKSSMGPETEREYAAMEAQEYEYKISGVNAEYFHKLAGLCRDRGIELIVVMAPMYDGYIEKINYESRYRSVSELTGSEDLFYIDCNKAYPDIGLTAGDFEDVFSGIVHLNGQGAEKVSRYTAGKIREYLHGRRVE